MATYLNRLALVAAGLSGVLLLPGCGRGESNAVDQSETVAIAFQKHGELKLLRGGESYLTIDVEIADSDSSRMRGMMQRTGFPDNTGMLFVFPVEEIQTFWMANTPVALDILFADSDSQIVDIHKYTRPLSPDNVVSDRPARFVLEIPAGFVDSHGVIVTDYLRWTKTEP